MRLNYRRQSTVGWNVWNFSLDLVGGVLCTSQVLLDGSTRGWRGVAADPIKLSLGGVSIVYDLVFVVQHFVLYTDRKDAALVPRDVRFHAGDGDDLPAPLLGEAFPPPVVDV